ncbi:hypothetical protein AB0G02_08885 [Actinosynnema sp. NPDC023658]|uniref:hypothetical protein n=1 Tax=Actinosynnema sp. NPDC023658 TaxID=3155465 RepID=UPI0033DC273D
MRILGKLAAAAGVTAVILLASPAANASPSLPVAGTSATKALPGLGPVTYIVNQVVSGLGGGLAGGSGVGGLGGGGGLGNLGG